jgi:hypothetical protein
VPKTIPIAGTLLFVSLIVPSILFGGEEKKQDVWEPLRFFVGSWARNKSVYEPQDLNPKGEVHEDWGLFSYDQSRRKIVFRQFHVEGFVNQYILDSLSADCKTLGFVTESVENIPSGWRARETYRILNKDEFRETFELAAPEKDFEVYIENHFKRKR